MAATIEAALNRFVTTCPLVVSVHDLLTKWRIQLKGGYALDIYFNDSNGKYSYTLSQGENRILGWDNAPHHSNLASFPHHYHNTDGTVASSALNGDPENDLEIVRLEIERLLREMNYE
jgi:hypothetical protein